MRRRWVLFVLAALTAVSAWINTANNDFALGYHYDEPKKVDFIRTGEQDFKHPLLMLQVMRVVHGLWPREDESATARQARTVNGVLGAFLVPLAFLLARCSVKTGWALLAAAGAASSPLLAVHAHYIKEDIALAVGATASLLLLVRLLRGGGWWSAAGLGVSLGWAAASKYVGLMLVPFCLLGPWLVPVPSRRRVYALLGPALLLCIVTVLAVNYPLFLNWDTFRRGLGYELEHVQRGHVLRIDPLYHRFGYHWLHSLVPGLGWPAAVLAVLAAIDGLIGWRRRAAADRLVPAFVLAMYFAAEAAPMKPHPGFMRYMVVLAPAVMVLVVQAAQRRLTRLRPAWLGSLAGGVVALALLSAGIRTLLLVHFLNRDTRDEAIAWLRLERPRTASELRRGPAARRPTYLAKESVSELLENGIALGVTTSLRYGRFLEGARLPGQSYRVQRLAQTYRQLFEHTIREFRPAYRTFAFSNPTVKVVDLRGFAIEKRVFFSLTPRRGGSELVLPGRGEIRYWDGRAGGRAVRVSYDGFARLHPGRYGALLTYAAAEPRGGGGWGRVSLHVRGAREALAEAAIPPRGRGPARWRELRLTFSLTETALVEPRVYGAGARLWLRDLRFVAEPAAGRAGEAP